MTVTVISDPASGQRTGDWAVSVNGSNVSRHRKKSAARKEARKRARKRGDVLKVQNRNGQIKTVRSYS